MRLDYQPSTRAFTLHVDRGEADVSGLMRDHGLDMSIPASTAAEACLFTREPYAACAFSAYASDRAQAELAPLLTEVAASWALAPASSHWPAHVAPADKTPYPLQLADLEYAIRRQHTLVADEPGVGKTPTAVMYGNTLAHLGGEPANFRALAIVPASIRLQWWRYIREWSTIPNVKVSVVTSSLRGVPPTTGPINWTILSYETAWRPAIERAILANTYDLIVLDEAHYLKTPTARRTRAIVGAADRGVNILSRARHVLALAGTPIPNRPREAYILAKALCPESIDFSSERAFNERFNPRDKWREGVGRTYELQARLRAGFMVRHLKRDALPQLRLPLYDLVYADETVPVRAALKAERMLDIDPETFTGADGKIDGAVSTARKLMGIALAPQVVRYVKMLADGGEDKIVVFGWHVEVLDILQKGLDKLGVVRVDGRTTEREKARAVVAFQQNPKIGVILGNVLSLGTGTDGLQQVSGHAVIAEPDWVIGNNIQMVDRLDRGGQTRQVLADFFVARGSLSERVLAAALRKGRVIHSALDQRIA